MNSILNKYQVRISTPVDYALYNKISTINPVMTQIIGNHYTIYDANALLSGVNDVISDPDIDKVDFYTNSLQLAVVTKTITKIYEDSDAYDDNNTITPFFTLPTQDFQVIAQAWRDYLLQSPNTPQ
jgi:hypothetical protein